MIVDSALLLLLSLLFGLLLLLASLHKFSDRLRFRGILAAYAVVPAALLPVAAFLVPVLELGLGIAWLTGFSSLVVAVGTASLLSFYAGVIALNILRGNTQIDCGCSFSSAKNADSAQGLSFALVCRNIVLAAAAMVVLLPGNGRELGVLDYTLLAFSIAAIALMYAALNQLLNNQNALRDQWQGDARHG